MSPDLPEKKIISRPGRKIVANSGQKLIVTVMTPRCLVDGHSHMENGACAPLPLLWDKSRLVRGKTREQIDESATRGVKGYIFSKIAGEAGPIQVMSTFDIGNRAVQESNETFAFDTIVGGSELYSASKTEPELRDFYSCMVILMMDMEYAHIAGYKGQTIYHDDEPVWYYYKRSSGLAEEAMGEKNLLPGENNLTFQKWSTQLIGTINAVKENPLKLFPMYSYAPQRWYGSNKTEFDRKQMAGPWDYPFSQVATLSNKGMFLGFKMYNPLGSQPLDPRLPYLHNKTLEGDCFYARCEREGIPIMVHCSPGGMTSHELPYFMEYDSGRTSYQHQSQYQSAGKTVLSDATTVPLDYEKTAVRHFYDNYVHPKAWRKVLTQYPKLKLCLAHLGGEEFEQGLNNEWVAEILALTDEYDNVYTDLSCWNMSKCKTHLRELLTSGKYPNIRYKLLFGTDWYMTLVALGGKTYRQFCEDAWEAFMDVPFGERIWVYCTFLNPFSFYGFYEIDPATGVSKMDNIAAALKNAKCDMSKLDENLSFFKRLRNEYDRLIEERKKIREV